MKIGIDLGGTKTEGVVLDPDNRLVERLRIDTPQSEGYDAILDSIAGIVCDLENAAGQPCSVGIGTPGSIDKHTHKLKYSNTVCLNDRSLQKDLENLLQKPVRIANDANCFALSESIDGSGKSYKTVFGVIMGTGVGGGIVVDNQIIQGPNGMSGEWGHTVLEINGNPCYCGLNGCVETCLSGPGIIKKYIQNGGQEVSRVEQILEHANAKEIAACKTMDQFYTDFARAISQIVKILDPDVIILGGGLSNIEGLYTQAAGRINDYFAAPVSVKLVRNTHGDSSGVRGAAFLW